MLTRRATKIAAAAAVAAGLLFATASEALAFHCYVADKPNGAGAVTLADFKEAGQSGNTVAPGAFVSTDETGAPNDIFIKGQPAEAPVPIEYQGEGTLPSVAHESGSPDHGVLEFAE